MRRVGICFMVAGLVLSACSNSSAESSSTNTTPTSETTDDSAPVEEPAPTTVIEDGLAAVIDGEPPSTTVSENPDEQAAADTLHWFNELFSDCLGDPQGCEVDKFAEVTTGGPLEGFTTNFAEDKRLGLTADIPVQPLEYTIFWARASETIDGRVGVLSCERNLTTLLNPDGSVSDRNGDGSTDVLLALMVEGDDGRWRMTELEVIRDVVFDKEEVNTCSNFNGTELSDAELEAYLS